MQVFVITACSASHIGNFVLAEILGRHKVEIENSVEVSFFNKITEQRSSVGVPCILYGRTAKQVHRRVIVADMPPKHEYLHYIDTMQISLSSSACFDFSGAFRCVALLIPRQSHPIGAEPPLNNLLYSTRSSHRRAFSAASTAVKVVYEPCEI